MSATRPVPTETTSAAIPEVPLTLEGWSVLHQMMRINWAKWRALPAAQQNEIAAEATRVLSAMEKDTNGQSALFSVLGHKGDLMFVHFRQAFDRLNQAELQLAKLRLSDYLESTTSYLSIIELGLYESTTKTYKALSDKGLPPHSEEWNHEIAEMLKRQKEAMHPRLFPIYQRIVTSVFIPWIDGGVRAKTGTRFPSKSGRGR